MTQHQSSFGILKSRKTMLLARGKFLRTVFLACFIACGLVYNEYQIEAIELEIDADISITEETRVRGAQVHTKVESVAMQDGGRMNFRLQEAILQDGVTDFQVEEASVEDIQKAFKAGTLTSRSLIEIYLVRIKKYDSALHSILEINPDVWSLADKADRERQEAGGYVGGLHGIPILIKDNIATKDGLNTSAGSYALLRSVVPRDAGVVERLRKAGAIILGKANLSEWANFRSSNPSSGWSARGGQTKCAYVVTVDPCGSSTGSAVATSANLVTVSLGTETDGSIICPSGRNSVVGIKPSVGLTSRAGVVPVGLNMDTVGPICRTVADAVEVLDSIVGFDPRDPATSTGQQWIPSGGYKQFLKSDGLRGKRLGVLRYPYFDINSFEEVPTLEGHLQLMRKLGATIVDNVQFDGLSGVTEGFTEETVLQFDFKQDLNAYLTELVESPVRSLADVIAFNNANPKLEKMDVYDQKNFYVCENTTGREAEEYIKASNKLHFLADGVYKLFSDVKLDAVIGPSFSGFSSVAAVGGYPAISVPSGFLNEVPFGISFIGIKGSEPTLIEIAYAFEQASHVRKSPLFFGHETNPFVNTRHN